MARYLADEPKLSPFLKALFEVHYNRATNATAARTLQSIIDSYLC
jgi:hypothetical protein